MDRIGKVLAWEVGDLYLITMYDTLGMKAIFLFNDVSLRVLRDGKDGTSVLSELQYMAI